MSASPRLTASERFLHGRVSVRDTLDQPDKYTLIDTLFSLAEAYLYMQLVEVKVGCQELHVALSIRQRGNRLIFSGPCPGI